MLFEGRYKITIPATATRKTCAAPNFINFFLCFSSKTIRVNSMMEYFALFAERE